MTVVAIVSYGGCPFGKISIQEAGVVEERQKTWPGNACTDERHCWNETERRSELEVGLNLEQERRRRVSVVVLMQISA